MAAAKPINAKAGTDEGSKDLDARVGLDAIWLTRHREGQGCQNMMVAKRA